MLEGTELIQAAFASIINGTHIQVSPLSTCTPRVEMQYDIDSLTAKTNTIPGQRSLELKLVTFDSPFHGILNLYHDIGEQRVDCGSISNISFGKFSDNGCFKVIIRIFIVEY